MLPESDAGDVEFEFECSEKKSRSTGGNTGDQEELFNASWDWVSDTEAEAEAEAEAGTDTAAVEAEACPIVMSDPIVSASHHPYDPVEAPPLLSSVPLIPLVAATEQRVSDPMVCAEQDRDTTECPVVCPHPGSLTSPPDSDVRVPDVSTADSAFNSPAAAPLTASGVISSDCVGALQNNSSVMLPSSDKASVSKQSSPSSSSCSSQYHITPLLSALLPTTIPPPTTHRLSHSASSPLLLSVSTVTSYSSLVSPSNHQPKSEIAASSVLPSPLTSPSASIDGISLRRVAVKAVAAAIEPPHEQEASNMTPSALTIDVLQSIDVSSPVSTLSESSLPLSPYALFLARNAAQAAAAQPCLSLSLSPPPPQVASARNAMLLTYEEEEAEYRAKHGTSWAPLSPTVYFSEPIEIDSKAWKNGKQNASRYSNAYCPVLFHPPLMHSTLFDTSSHNYQPFYYHVLYSTLLCSAYLPSSFTECVCLCVTPRTPCCLWRFIECIASHFPHSAPLHYCSDDLLGVAGMQTVALVAVLVLVVAVVLMCLVVHTMIPTVTAKRAALVRVRKRTRRRPLTGATRAIT